MISADIIMQIIVIGAIIVGPIAAVQIEKYLERKREQRTRKLWIFSTLMATRATRLSPAHVEALNRIEVEFYKDRSVMEARKVLLDAFENFPQDEKVSDYSARLEKAVEKSNDCLVKLLHQMSECLGYHFDEVHLKKGVYAPRGHAEVELQQYELRKLLLAILKGDKPIAVKDYDRPNK